MNQSEFYSKKAANSLDFTGKSSELNLLFLLFAFLFGSSLLFIDVQYIFILLIASITMIFFIIKPIYCYYLVILTIPLIFRLRFLPVSFSINDILILMCALAIFANLIFVDKKVNFRTGLDKWIAALLALFLLAGITSINPNGILTAFKFLEAVLVFYFTVYFVRTKKLNISDIIRIIIITALIQASIGILQAVTGSFGANFQSDRGYLGRLGVGSTMVWHGIGTMEHFNGLGNYLTAILLFFIPVYHYICKNKTIGKTILSILFWGLIITYSRGSLIGIFAGILYFLSQIIKNKLRFTLLLIFFLAVTGIVYLFLSQTSYVQTLSPRDRIWEGLITSITSSPRYLWFGAGLNSYNDTVLNFLPANQQWFAHNFYLLCVQEMGIIGSIIFFSFLITLQIQTWFAFKKNKGLLKALNFSVSLVIFSIFFVSIYDHSYSLTFFKILLFLLLGLIYAKNKASAA